MLLVWQGVQALEETSFQNRKIYATPLREQSIIISEEGFYPKNITAFKGEKIRFFVTAVVDEKSCFIIKGKDLFLSAEKGKISEGVAFFENSGKFEFYCPTLPYKGYVTILEKFKAKKKRKQRTIASEKLKVWMPKEE